jgi:hypothetical protein
MGGGAFMMRVGGGGARVQRDGSFTIPNVTPGTYQLTIRSGGPGEMGFGMIGAATDSDGEPETATLRVTVGSEDLPGLVLTTSPGVRMSGQIVFEGGVPPAGPEAASSAAVLSTSASPDDPGMPGPGFRGSVKEDWTFELRGLSGERLIDVVPPRDWYLKSIQHGGRDYTSTPMSFGSENVTGVQIVLTNRRSTLAGAVTDQRGQPVNEYSIVVFADDKDLWGFRSRYVQMVRPDQDGRYKWQGPPERYLAVAVEFVEEGQWMDPDWLERMREHASSVSVSEGETKTLNLKLAPAS